MATPGTGTPTAQGSPIRNADEKTNNSTLSGHADLECPSEDDSENKPLHHYYQHLLKRREGKLVKPKRPVFLGVSRVWVWCWD
jgi:hypothetical protein